MDWPHYTRPPAIDGLTVPAVLMSGDHAAIHRWRLQQALGRTWLRRPELLDRLHERNVVVSLQFDGFKAETYEVLRGHPLLDEKRRILEMLRERHLSTSLTMTVAAGLNDDQFPIRLLAFTFWTP